MANLAKSVARTAWSQYRLNVLFPPGGRVALGDVLAPDRGVYRHEATLEGLGVPKRDIESLVVREDEIGALLLASADGVAVDVGSEVTTDSALVPTPPRGTAVVTLARGDSFLLAIAPGNRRYFSDLSPLQGAVTSLIARRRWQRQWIVVTELWETPGTTFLAGAVSGAHYELSIAGEMGVADMASVLVDQRTALSRHSGVSLSYVNGPSSTPLFRAHRWDGSLRPAGWRPGTSRTGGGSRVDQEVLEMVLPVPVDEPITAEGEISTP